MALALTIEKLEDVDEGVRTLYVEKDGKFHLDVDGIDQVTTAAIKAATTKANREAAELRIKAKSWEKFGKSPEELEQLLTDHEELVKLREERELTEAEKKGQWDQLKQQMNEKHQSELRKKDLAIEEERQRQVQLRKSIESHLIQSAAISAISEHKGIPRLLLPVVANHIRIKEDSGKFNVEVVDESGEPRVNGKGDPLTLSEFVGEMQSDEVYGRAFEGTGSSGSGTRPGQATGAPPGGPSRRSDFKSEKDRAAYIEKHGLETYKSLPM